jgi:hypothetical protein
MYSMLTIRTPDYTTLNGGPVVNNELGKIWNASQSNQDKIPALKWRDWKKSQRT